MRQKIWLKILAVLALLVLALALFWNWDWFLPLVDAQASAALGRPVRVQHLHVHLGRIIRAEADGIAIANPKGFPADASAFGSIDALRVDMDVWAYIVHRQLSLNRIELDRPVFNVRQIGAQNNYTLASSSSGSSSKPVLLGALVIDNGAASVILPGYKTNFDLTIQTQDAPPASKLFTGSEIIATAHGTYAGAPITGHFTGGALLALRDNATPYPVELQLQNGATSAQLSGTIDDPAHFAGAHLRLRFAGQNMADLYQLTGVPVPATPPFSLLGDLTYTQSAFHFENFTGRVGTSDVEGSITEIPGSPRRQINAVLTSHRVDLTDLAGFLGATPGNANTPGQDAATRQEMTQAAARPNLIPNTPINLPKLDASNIDLSYHGEHIINQNAPLDNVVVHLVVQDGQITVNPLNFAVGTGTIASDFSLAPVDNVLHAKANIDFRNLPLARLMAATHAFAGDGTVGGTAWLSGSGNSMAAILGHGNGHASLFLQHGADISALMVDLVGLQGGDAILSALGVPQKTVIQCMVSDFSLADGTMTTQALLLATSEANILGSGTANLQNEKLNMQLRTEATHFSIGSLSTPIDIGGTLKHPSVLPAAGPLAARAGGAVGLGLLFPPLAILPTVRLGLGDKNACVDTLTAIHSGHPHNPS